jgi:hypothetical protein
MKKVEEIEQTIQNLHYDLKAEAVLGDLIENGLVRDDFVVIPQGTFKRKYSRDIDYTDKIKLNNGQELVGIHINRDAIYDALPEGLFHQKTETIAKEQKNISKESKRLKAEEKAARIFFLPFENELFSQGINLELEERKILSHFSENFFDNISPRFWDLDESVSRKYVSRMVRFLHISHKIASAPKRIEKCLEAILEENVAVSITKNNAFIKVKSVASKSVNECFLGSVNLGVDFVCGDTLNDMGYTILFNIGPLKNTCVTDYLENGAISNFLKCFFDYFIPVELEVITNIHVPPEKQSFTLQPSGEAAILGYITAI